MRLSEVHPYVEAGQYWARKCPIGLFQILKAIADENSGWIKLQGWTKDRRFGEEEEFSYVAPLPNIYVYLWFKREYPIPEGSKVICHIGDVWITDTGELFFIGPESTEEKLSILSDSVISDIEIQMATLYQEGPCPPEKSLNRFQRELEPQSP